MLSSLLKIIIYNSLVIMFRRLKRIYTSPTSSCIINYIRICANSKYGTYFFNRRDKKGVMLHGLYILVAQNTNTLYNLLKMLEYSKFISGVEHNPRTLLLNIIVTIIFIDIITSFSIVTFITAMITCR